MFDVNPEYRQLIGQHVTAEFAGRTVEGVVQTIDHEYTAHDFEPRIKLARGDATLSVSPEAIVD